MATWPQKITTKLQTQNCRVYVEAKSPQKVWINGSVCQLPCTQETKGPEY